MMPLPGSLVASLLRFLFLGLSAVAQAKLTIHGPAEFTQLQAVEGGEVVLPASYSLDGVVSVLHPGEMPVVIWFKEQEGRHLSQVLAYINGAVSSKPRVSLAHTMPSRNVSLRLRDLREEDSGSYVCTVNVGDTAGSNLAHSSKTLELTVLVPPAPPSCHLMGMPHVGGNVTLSCQSPRSKPTAKYRWMQLPPFKQVFYSPVLDEIQGSLSLTNLSATRSGVYVCTARNEVGSAQCNVTLAVSTGPGASVVAGAVVGTLVGLGLLAGLVLLYQRSGKALEEPANDIKEDAVAPRTLPWPKGSDTVSKNGTLSSVTSARALRPPPGPLRPGALTPTPSLSSQALPSPRPSRTNGAHPRPASPGPGGVSPSALSRMGATPLMVPAQSQAGSLV
ncbi:endothelial cell-selective adhesion molecule isoform X2 [Tupaia chinensis]|uniref:endothelial cell-selective adhesion molecule isoform X1 n=1 Tax=Tupaia chinensis TaxID=246437 RepID=UPI0003C923AF|nr:endothelial cell-selective adhesion molecule isoform X1 [Tupaia chinensis]XP_014444202.1 endothelial cell-selective adhesion molecule isoform X2 [Tupaia chinensis]